MAIAFLIIAVVLAVLNTFTAWKLYYGIAQWIPTDTQRIDHARLVVLAIFLISLLICISTGAVALIHIL